MHRPLSASPTLRPAIVVGSYLRIALDREMTGEEVQLFEFTNPARQRSHTHRPPRWTVLCQSHPHSHTTPGVAILCLCNSNMRAGDRRSLVRHALDPPCRQSAMRICIITAEEDGSASRDFQTVLLVVFVSTAQCTRKRKEGAWRLSAKDLVVAAVNLALRVENPPPVVSFKLQLRVHVDQGLHILTLLAHLNLLHIGRRCEQSKDDLSKW